MTKHFHDHTHEHYGLSALAEHLRIWHKDGDVPEVDEPHGSQHVFDVPAHDSDSARIDVHPWAAPLFETAEVVFVSIEGVQKADAILSAIRRYNLAASVYSVPSVTLWRDPTTPRFAREFLADKTVIVIPDADWADPSKQGAVENQARIYHGYLLSLGVPRVHVAAAPEPPEGFNKDKGIDDFLGKLGGTLQQMVCFDVEPPNRRTVTGWVNATIERKTGDTPHARQTKSLVDMITSLSMFASAKEGTVSVSQGCVANILGVSVMCISDRLAQLTDLEAIEYDGSLAAGRNYFGSMDWVDKPSIRIVPDELRARMLPKRTLEEVLGEVFFKGRT